MNNFHLYNQVLGQENREAIVFLPGFTGTHKMWDKSFQTLSQHYKLVFLDTLGFGESPKPAEIEYSVDDHLTSIRNTLQSLKISNCNFVSYSMGTLLALAYARHFPQEVAKLALISVPYYQDEHEVLETIQRSSLFNRWFALDIPLVRRACAIMCYLRPVFQLVAPALARDVPAVIARDALQHTWHSYFKTLQNVIIHSPIQRWLNEPRHSILIMQGEQDRVAPIENVRQAIEGNSIEGNSYAKLIVCEGNHNLVFRQAVVLTAQIKVFFQDAPPKAEISY